MAGLGGTGISRVGIWQAGVDIPANIGEFALTSNAAVVFDGSSVPVGSFALTSVSVLDFEGDSTTGDFSLETYAEIGFAFQDVVAGGESLVCLPPWLATAPPDRDPASAMLPRRPSGVSVGQGPPSATIEATVERTC